MLTMTEINLTQQRVMIREDFNVPLDKGGHITSDARLLAALPTIKQAILQNAAVIILSHLGRPTEGVFMPELSLAPVAKRLALLCPEIPVHFAADWLSGISTKPGEIVLCENVRFNSGEKKNDPTLAKRMAAMSDIFVMDAFATAHRAHASTYGMAQFAKIACAGPLLVAELNALTQAFAAPEPPVVAIVGGAKVSTKLGVLSSLIEKVDAIILGGGIANTFLAAQGYFIGTSLYEADLVEEANALLALAAEKNVRFILPLDVVVATHCHTDAVPIIKPLSEISDSEMILDVGPKTGNEIHMVLQKAKTIIWNGPLGVFELPPFSQGTQSLALSIAQSPAYSVAGGGDTLAAIEKYQIHDQVSYLSTGGGAFLEFLENKPLPCVEILRQRVDG